MEEAAKEKDPQKKELPLHLKRILSVIPHDRTITCKEIAALTGESPETVRHGISKLVLLYHKPIGTFNRKDKNGYKIITNDLERDETVANLQSRAIKIWQRSRAIESIPDFNQTELFN